MLVGRVFLDQRAIDVIGPNRGEGADIARHAGHKPGNQRGDAQAEEARATIADEHKRQDGVVALAARSSDAGAAESGKKGQSSQAGQDHEEGNEHLESGADDRSHFRGAKILRSHQALNLEKVGGPITERNDDSLADQNADPIDVLGVIERAEIAPEMHVLDRTIVDDLELQIVPAARFNQSEDRDEHGTGPNQDELEDFVEDGGAQAAEGDVDGDGDGGNPDAEVHVPAEDDVHDQRHGIHVDAAHKDGHEGEADAGKSAAGFVEAELEIAGNRMRLRDVVERHHEEAEEEHRGNSSNPVGVRGEHAVFVGGTGPAHELERAEIGGNEAEAGDPGGHFAAGHEEVFAGVRALLQIESDAQDEGEVKSNDGDVDWGKMGETR